MKTVSQFFLVCGLAFLSLVAGAQQTSFWTYHNNNHRDGLNTNETILNLTNVTSTSFGKIFSYAVDGYVYTQPLYVPNVNIAGRGTHNVVFIGTEHNTVYALDADSAGVSGGLLWKTNLGPAAVTTTPTYTNQTFGGRYNGGAFTDIEPEVGITGTPVIDTNTGTLYVDAFTGVVGGGVTNYFHTMHALDITSGAERPYSPVTVVASVAGVAMDSTNGVVTFNARQENQRPALTLAGGIVYVAYAGYADTDPYHGWIIGYNATNLTVLTNYVFNTTPNATVAQFPEFTGEGGIWMGGGGLAVDDNTNLYVSVANGSFDVTNNTTNVDYGDSFLKLTTSNGLVVADYFTPWNQYAMQAGDQDLGSGGLTVLPDQPGPVTHEMIGAGKPGEVFMVNRDQFTTNNMHFDATNTIDFVLQTNKLVNGGGAVFDTLAYFNSTVYVVASSDSLRAIPLVNGLMSGVTADFSRTYSFPGATPSISACGTSNGIVWTLQKATPQVLVANNATNVTQEIYNSSLAGTRDRLASPTKFAVPTVADGRVFAGGSNSLAVFGLLSGNISFSPAYFVTKSNTNLLIGVNRLGGTNGAVQVSYATVAGGTATSGVNYSPVSGELNWANGESGTKTFMVPIFDDGQVDPNETVQLALSNPTNAAAVGPVATAMLTIISPPGDLWKIFYFGGNANNVAIAGDAADPDSDHSPNLLEYAYASNPTVAGTNMFLGQVASDEFRLTFPRDVAASDITYEVQASGSLLTWSNLLTFDASNGWVTNAPGATVTESATNGTLPYQSVNVTATVSTNMNQTLGGRFYRLRIHR